MKISILGLGWFGLPLAQQLKADHEVSGTSRSLKLHPGISVEFLDQSTHPSSEILNAEVIVLNIPPFKGQLEWFKSWKWSPRSHVIFISSTSVYGEAKGSVDEKTLPLPQSESAKILWEEEQWIMAFPQYTIVRFGGLFGGERHPGKSLSGKTNLSGANDPVNLLHLDDAVSFVKLLTEKKITQEIFNLVHPDHPTRERYYQSYCRTHRLPLPQFLPHAGSGKTICSKKVSQIYSFKKKSLLDY